MAQPPSAAAPMIPGSTPSGAAPAAPGDADAGPETTITITCAGDGTYTITQDDGDADAQGAEPAGDADSQGEQPVTVQSPADVLQVVKQMLAGSGGDPASAWQAEASKRGPTGMPAPAMSM